MTTEEMFDDLKQFIDARFAQQDADWDKKLKNETAPINKKLDDLIEFVTDEIDTANETNGTQLTDHETRITKLENAAA